MVRPCETIVEQLERRNYVKTFVLILLLALSFPVASQSGDDLKLFADFDPREGCETLEIRLDNFFTAYYETPGSIGYVVVRKGDNPIDNAFVYRKTLNYPNFATSRSAVMLRC